MQQTFATVEVNLPSGKKTIEMLLKERKDLEECGDGTIIMINLCNGETLTGFFKGITEDNNLKIRSLNGKTTLGYQLNWIVDYFEDQLKIGM